MSGISFTGTPTGADLVVGGATIARIGDGTPDPISLVRVKDAQRVLLATGTANNSAEVVLSWADTSFDRYELIYTDMTTDSAAAIGLDISIDGGSTFLTRTSLLTTTANGLNTNAAAPAGGTSTADGSVGGTQLTLLLNSTGTVGPATGQPCWGKLDILDNAFISYQARFTWFTQGSKWAHTSAGYRDLSGNITPVNAIRIRPPQTGLIGTGKFRLYGIR